MRKHMKKLLKTLGLIAIAAVVLLTAYSFLFGRLSSFSPYVTGFRHKDFKRVVVYYHGDADLRLFDGVDSLIARTEAFHEMRFRKKVRIFLPGSDRENMRISGAKTRFVSMPLNGSVFISPKAMRQCMNGEIPLDIFLRHELSHSIIHQNMSLYHWLRFPKWMFEGVATYSSDMMGVERYYSKDEVFRKIREGYFLQPDDWGTFIRGAKPSVAKFPLPDHAFFFYSEFACIVDDLIASHGKKRFLTFLRMLMADPDIEKVFPRVYKTGYREYIKDFQRRAASSDLK
jgi:hypothetical protein